MGYQKKWPKTTQWHCYGVSFKAAICDICRLRPKKRTLILIRERKNFLSPFFNYLFCWKMEESLLFLRCNIPPPPQVKVVVPNIPNKFSYLNNLSFEIFDWKYINNCMAWCVHFVLRMQLNYWIISEIQQVFFNS